LREVSTSCSTIPFLRLGDGEPLVFIHGLGETKEGWNNQFEFANQYDLIIPDIRGHGENITTEKISIAQFANDIINLLTELQWMQSIMHKKIQHSDFVIVRNTGHISKLEQKKTCVSRLKREQ
jgi:hypothetical protein